MLIKIFLLRFRFILFGGVFLLVFGGLGCEGTAVSPYVKVGDDLKLKTKAIGADVEECAFKCTGPIDFDESSLNDLKDGVFRSGYCSEGVRTFGTANASGNARCVFMVQDDSGQIQTCWVSFTVSENVDPSTVVENQGGTPLEPIEYSFANPVEHNSFSEWLLPILRDIQGAVVYLVLAFILLGGIVYMISAGNTSRMTKAKSLIMSAIVGFVIVIGVPSLVFEILNPFISDESVTKSLGEGQASSFFQIASSILDLIILVLGSLALIGFVISGGLYLTTIGNPSAHEKAKKGFIYTVIGIFVASSSLIIIRQITNILSGGG